MPSLGSLFRQPPSSSNHPASPVCSCELQARVIFAQDPDTIRVRRIQGLEPPASGRMVSYRGYDHIYFQNLTGGRPGDDSSFEEQARAIFDRAETVLEEQDLTFHDVVRNLDLPAGNGP